MGAMTYNIGGAIIEPDRFELTGTTSHYDYIGALLPSSGRGGKKTIAVLRDQNRDGMLMKQVPKIGWPKAFLRSVRSASSGSAAPSNAQKHSHQK